MTVPLVVIIDNKIVSAKRINCVTCVWMQISVLVFMANSLFFWNRYNFMHAYINPYNNNLTKIQVFLYRKWYCLWSNTIKRVYCICEGAPYNGVIIHHSHMLICLYLCLPLLFFFRVSDAITNWVFWIMSMVKITIHNKKGK